MIRQRHASDFISRIRSKRCQYREKSLTNNPNNIIKTIDEQWLMTSKFEKKMSKMRALITHGYVFLPVHFSPLQLRVVPLHDSLPQWHLTGLHLQSWFRNCQLRTSMLMLLRVVRLNASRRRKNLEIEILASARKLIN